MELYLQFGHGMKSLSIDLAKKWGSLTTILSPRDMSPQQMKMWCNEFNKNNIKCLFDPQCYCPKSNSAAKKLLYYDYWDSGMNTSLGSDPDYPDSVIKIINKYNDIAETESFIVPNILDIFSDKWKQNWTKRSINLINSARKIIKNKEIFATLTLPSGALCQVEDEIESLIQEISGWDVDGYYIIAEVPDKKYLVDNPLWLSNIFQICAALKLINKKVIFGYGNHQMLPLSLMKVDAIASGTWLNVRSFSNRFIDSDETKRKSTWIYYPHSLSEYKLAFIDLAYSLNIIKDMKPQSDFTNDYSRLIYETKALPSSTGINETLAFKYYLDSLGKQIELLSQSSYKEALLANEVLLNTAEMTIQQLEKKGIYAQTRSFRDIIDINRAAINILNQSRGFALSLAWNNL